MTKHSGGHHKKPSVLRPSRNMDAPMLGDGEVKRDHKRCHACHRRIRGDVYWLAVPISRTVLLQGACARMGTPTGNPDEATLQRVPFLAADLNIGGEGVRFCEDHMPPAVATSNDFVCTLSGLDGFLELPVARHYSDDPLTFGW